MFGQQQTPSFGFNAPQQPLFGQMGAPAMGAPNTNTMPTMGAPNAFPSFGAPTTNQQNVPAFGQGGGMTNNNPMAGPVQINNTNQDYIVPNPPTDTITTIAFNTSNALFTAGGWSKEINCYEFNPQTGAQLRAQQKNKSAILCSSFHNDGTKLFYGGCDNMIQIWNIQSNQLMQAAQHSSPIKECQWVPDAQLLVTGSWDKTIKYWDMRQGPTGNAITVNVPERVYAMDCKYPYLVVATAAKSFLVYNLQNPSSPFRTDQSPLKYQIRSVSLFPDKTGFAAGSVEGRVAISHLSDKDNHKNFAFKCHREKNDVYSVNALSFHNPCGTFATAGSDGTYVFWDKDAKQRLKAFNALNNSITTASFNPAGNIFAYAIGYDYSKGFEYYERLKQPCGILLHAVQEAEIQKKPKTGK